MSLETPKNKQVDNYQSLEKVVDKTQILIAESEDELLRLFNTYFSSLGMSTEIANDGEKAMEIFNRFDSNPDILCLDLILLDINLPRMRGSEVLEHMRASKKCGDSKVLVVTSSDSPSDIEEMNRLGANGYFKKASEFSEFMKLGEIVRSLLPQ